MADESKPHPYSPIVTVFTVFFSAFMAIGLQKILENLNNQKWLCFLIAFTLFFRFLTGSANHLWFKYVRVNPSPAAKHDIVWHFVWLLLFGFIALEMCYADSAGAFLVW